MTETIKVPPVKNKESRWGTYIIGVPIAFLLLVAFLFLIELSLGINLIPTLPTDFLFNLFFGWGLFLWKTIPQVTVSLPGVATFIVALILFATGIHFAGRHWYRLRSSVNETTPQRIWQLRWTAQIVCSIVLLFASGIAIVGVTHQGIWLMTSKDHWMEYHGSVGRRTARRSTCKNNLKQIGLALHNYHDMHHAFPPGGIFDETGRPMHSWATMLLPFIDQAPLYKQIDFSQPWDAPANAKSFQQSLPAFICPSSKHSAKNPKGQAIISSAGNSRVFSVNSRTRIRDITDGTSNTLLAGEVNSRFKPWGDPVSIRNVDLGINDRNRNSFGSEHVGGAHFLFADGRVRFLSENIDPATLRVLSTPSKGDIAGEY